MKKFFAVYKGSPNSDNNRAWNELNEEDRNKRVQEGMQAWHQWMKTHEKSIIDGGGPLGKTIGANKSGTYPTQNDLCGYVIVEAASHEDAAKMFLGHPHFSIFPGESIDILECLPIPTR